MNRGAVAAIAIAVLLVAAFIAMTDPSRNGQQLALAVGFFASVVILVGIISLAGEGGSTRGNTSQTVNVYMPPQQAAPLPPAAPQVVYTPMPQTPQPHYLPPGYAQPYLPPPQQQPAYLPAPQHAQYRGALDVVAEPVPYALGYHPQPQQVQRGAVAQLESPKASLVRRMARRLVG